MRLSNTIHALVVATLAAAANPVSAGIPEEALYLQREWARINYELPESDRADAMEKLVTRCDDEAGNTAGVETVIWCGIVRSTYAGMASPFSAMKYAKAARKDFEKAIEIDGDALSGSAYTSLGTLYYKVPGWPVGFGSHEEAQKHLEKGLAINPDGIDPNFFYGEYLFEQGDYAKSREHLLKAQRAPARPDRPVADRGRQEDIQALLTRVERKLGS
jgi:tetratricopeptide (TPR) repeat protein